MRALLLVLSLTFLASCSTHSNKETTLTTAANPREYQIGAYLWLQTSGEYRALVYQAYNIARERVERDLEDKHNRKRAVVFDIDETILDNSFGGADEIQKGLSWKDNKFSEWVKKRKAIAIPGTLEFVKFLADRQVEVFYISNRKVDMFEDTYANLVNVGFPVKKENLMLMGAEHSKEARRQVVLKKYDVIVYVGDNLTDFPGGFEKTSVEVRNALADKMKGEFGRKLIVLPNPMYGDWERALPMDKARVDLLKNTP